MGVQNDTFILSQRGWLITGVLAALFIFFSMIGFHLFQFIFGALLITVVMIFRNPERNPAQNHHNGIVSNVDGVILSIGESMVEDEKMIKLTVMNSLWGVSILRTPFDATIGQKELRRGATLPVYNPLSDMLNEKGYVSFLASNGHKMIVEHISEQSCFKMEIDADTNQRLKEGERYGFLAKGRTNIYLPKETQMAVNVGMNLKAGSSLLGYFPA